MKFMPSFKGKDAPAPVYRFTVGTQVLCRTGAEEWSAGQIVALNYRESHWPPGKTVPYQVKLHKGPLIFVPADAEQLCRKLVPPWWEAALSMPDSYYFDNPPADVLLQAGANKNVNDQDNLGKTGLMQAVERGWPNAVAQLIKMKADVNIPDDESNSALHFAVRHGPAIVKLLVDAKADLNVQDNDPDYDPEFSSTSHATLIEHRTPLHYSSLLGDVATSKLLLDAGAKINMRDAQLKTPLHVAIDADKMNTIDLLLSSGADLNLGNYSSGVSNTPLMDAAFAGKTELLQKLIDAKSDVNRQGKQDMSALHLAARNRRLEAAELLLAAKADMNQESKCGTALGLARKNGGVDLLDVFGVKPLAEANVNTEGITSFAGLDAAQRAALHLE
jgi:ankyrin repeat protein